MQFLTAQMNAGKITAGGPFQGGERSGGLLIFSGELRQEAIARAIVEGDPLVANHVVTYSIPTWAQCQEAAPPPTN